MVDPSDVIKVVDWVKDFVTEPAGTAELKSYKANWKEDPQDTTHYELTRAPALTVSAYRTNVENENPFSVSAEREGGFSMGARPAQMRDVAFYIGDHNTGDGTSLTLNFEHAGADVDLVGDRWILLWNCWGHFKIRHDVEVDYRARLIVDTDGAIDLESPWVEPASGQSYTYEGGMSTEWAWEAVFGMFGHPQLAIAFTLMTPQWG